MKNAELSYSDYVSLVLHSERLRIQRILDMSQAVAIGTNEAGVPDSWINLITDDPSERAKWKRNELRRGL